LKVEKNDRKDFDGLCIYFWWELYKERNRRVFQGLEKNEREVAGLAKVDFDQPRVSFFLVSVLCLEVAVYRCL